MKRGFTIFWIIYMLFFAIPFPMLLYYNIKSETDILELKDQSPWVALSLLGVSIIIWIILLMGYFKRWFLQIFISKKNIEHIKNKGVRREAKILSAVKTSSLNAKYNTYELELSFKNLADSEIIQKITVNDAKPHERRFEVDKKTGVLLDRDMKHKPYFIIATSDVSINILRTILILLTWLALLAGVIWYYIYSYKLESHGMGWRFIGFGHPLIVCALVLLFYKFISRLVFRKLLGDPDDMTLIKFKGIKTWAKVIRVSQTGTYINEQPMIRFDLEYTDNHKQLHRESLKKIVDLLNLDSTKQEQVGIFYLPDNPKQIAFASDLNEI
ncbi:hypothetical protein [Flavobacterium cerinum]|uniref:Uncharacterized protein n=1 Tax=Flavobacterium cerinum TaxID=2502784 RepID=A0A444HAS4_9FLAO|nr:hypothetical protein [Flavobacterium cerinum]RWX00420.1 hypothetical protein EPI11_09075 [Flavobacterium cerinum]